MSENYNINKINIVSAQFNKVDYVGIDVDTGNLYYHTPDNILSMVSAINTNAETLAKACFSINQVQPNKNNGNLEIKGQNGIQVSKNLENNSVIIKNINKQSNSCVQKLYGLTGEIDLSSIDNSITISKSGKTIDLKASVTGRFWC